MWSECAKMWISIICSNFIHTQLDPIASNERGHPRWQDRRSFDRGRGKWEKIKYMSSSLRVSFQGFSSFALPHCWNSIWSIWWWRRWPRKKRIGMQWGNRERMIISISILVILLPPLKSFLHLLWKITAALWKITPLFLRESIYNWGRGFSPLLAMIKFSDKICYQSVAIRIWRLGNFVLILLLESYHSHIFLFYTDLFLVFFILFFFLLCFN